MTQDHPHEGHIQDWRELCAQVACEVNPKKLMDLIAQLTKTLDERNKK